MSELTTASAESSDENVTGKAQYSLIPDYSAWRCPTYEINSLDDLLQKSEFENGIHKVRLKTTTLDILIQGINRPKNNDSLYCLIGLSGAISNRAVVKSRPPFFSGRGIATELSLPLISISDPSLSLNETLPLGWYAGNNDERLLLNIISHIIDKIMSCHDLHPLLFGGSGGGYAALALSHLLSCESTTMAWNAQTSIGKYVPSHVLHYLDSAFPELSQEIKKAEVLVGQEQKECIADLLDRTGILHSLWGMPRPAQAKVLYLQNESDWHVSAHAKPYLEGSNWQRLGPSSFSQGKDVALHMGNWGPGHATPPKDVIVHALGQLTKGKSVGEVATQLSALRDNEKYCHWFAVDIDPQWTPSVSCTQDSISVHVKIDASGLPCLEGLEYAVYLLNGSERKAISWYQSEPEFTIPLNGLSVDGVRAFVRDMWTNVRITQKSLPRFEEK
jgi:hypothetical protein